MKIAVDAKNLANAMSGIGRVAAETLRQIGGDVEVILLSPSKINAAYTRSVAAHRARVTRTPRAMWALRILRREVVRAKPDVFWGPAHRVPFGLPPELPVVLTVHDLVWKRHPQTMPRPRWLGERLLFPQAVRRANLIACVSQSTADDLAHYFPKTKNKIRVVYPGANPPQTTQKEPQKPFALFVGTMEPRKNLARLIEAFAALPQKAKNNFNLVIAGGAGWGGVDAKTLIAKYGVQPHARVIHAPDDATLHQLYADCAFLVMPSLYEGFGLPIVEALQYGKPVITSNVSSLPEVAASAGLFVNPVSVADITQALAELIEKKSLYTSLSKNAIVEAKRFSWQRTATQMVELFNEAAHLTRR